MYESAMCKVCMVASSMMIAATSRPLINKTSSDKQQARYEVLQQQGSHGTTCFEQSACCLSYLRRMHGIENLLEHIALNLVLQTFDGLLHTVLAGLQSAANYST